MPKANKLPPPPAPPAPMSKFDTRPSYITKVSEPPAKPEKDLSGMYRMIHGGIEVVVPREHRLTEDGTVNEHAPKTRRATIHPVLNAQGQIVDYVADELWLSHADAKMALAANLVEPLSTPPEKSRVGKCFTPPKTTDTWRGNTPIHPNQLPR
jgi:hypothetical protein